MGVINITPDSFSDGGISYTPNNALKRAGILLSQGADILDIGAQSTRPGAKEIGHEEELRRLSPALRLIKNKYPNAIISVDTFFSQVAHSAIQLGADWINDVTAGRRDPDILRVVADCGCPYVLTHSRGNSLTMTNLTNYNDVTKEVKQELLERTDLALKNHILPTQIIWDPGLGFAKTTEQNLLLLKQLEQISKNQFPLLVGPSRKRFIGEILDEPNPKKRLFGTAAIACRCAQLKIDIIRVHDVAPIVQILTMAKEIWP